MTLRMALRMAVAVLMAVAMAVLMAVAVTVLMAMAVTAAAATTTVTLLLTTALLVDGNPAIYNKHTVVMEHHGPSHRYPFFLHFFAFIHPHDELSTTGKYMPFLGASSTRQYLLFSQISM